MSRVFYFVFISIFIAGCSSPARVEKNIKPDQTDTVSNKSVATMTNQLNSNAEALNNSNGIVIQNSAITKDNVRNMQRKAGGSKETTPIAANISVAAIAAPDNSEVISQMNEKGQPLERRTFKNHPVLAKIERIDLDNQNIKVYLKSGKIVNLPADQADNFLTARADDILKAVGMK